MQTSFAARLTVSSTGSDAKISGSKIEPLDSEQKEGVSRDESGGGAAGTDVNIDQARIDPVGGKGRAIHRQTENDASRACFAEMSQVKVKALSLALIVKA